MMNKLFAKAWLLLTVFMPIGTHAAALTLYTTSWSMYGDHPYEYDGAYKVGEPYGKLKYVSNPEMVAQFNRSNVVV
jgi:chitinase